MSLANVFWGLWLFPFGLLVLKSAVMPRILGWWLMADCCALVGVSLTALLLPGYVDATNRRAIVPELGELWVTGWRLVRGLKEKKAVLF